MAQQTLRDQARSISGGEEDDIRVVYAARERWDRCDPRFGSGRSRRVFADGPCWGGGQCEGEAEGSGSRAVEDAEV